MQVNDYSLDAQKDKLRKYAEYQDMTIVSEFSDAGFSGKNIKGRPEFSRMMEKTLQTMQNYGVDLSQDTGKLMISVLSTVAKMERENIRTQTMTGKKQKAKESKSRGSGTVVSYLIDIGKKNIK